MEKQGLLTSFSMFMKMGKKNKKPVLMLIICYIKGISRSASCWNLRYHTRGMLPVSTQAPSHCPNCWYIRWKEVKKTSNTDLVIHTHKPSPTFISLCVSLHYWIPQQAKRQTSLRCFIFSLLWSFVLHKAVKPDPNVEYTHFNRATSILTESVCSDLPHTPASQEQQSQERQLIRQLNSCCHPSHLKQRSA